MPDCYVHTFTALPKTGHLLQLTTSGVNDSWEVKRAHVYLAYNLHHMH